MINKYYINEKDLIEIKPNVSCIGFFDGVHLGHQALIKKTIEIANKEKVEPYLITFFPDPQDIISNNKTKHINSFERRIKLFEKFGIKAVIVIEFSKDVMSLKKEDFVDKYLKKLNLKGLVCGFDFHYGYKGIGDYRTLKKDMKKTCPIYMVDEVKYYGKKVSSSRIKQELTKGNIRLVNKLLGYEYK